jgi:Ni,Fe-hydrogenase maturation factor
MMTTGSVYVFEKNSTGQYQQVSKLVASDGAAGDLFGFAVSATASMVVVAAVSQASNSGSVYVFKKKSTGQYEQVSKLMASDGAVGDSFGRAVAATDSMMVVGAWGDDDNGDRSGSVYVFEKNSTGQYQQVSKLVASDGAAGDQFGWTVAASDGMVVVGAYEDDDKGLSSGSVYVFKKNITGQYEQASKLVASDGAAFHNFGVAVAATDAAVVVGAFRDDDNGSGSGSMYVFEKNSTGQYEQARKLVASDGAANDGFGRAVAATDSIVVVGAWQDDGNSGSVYVFESLFQ